ncbi:galactokinase [Haematomicrobium sanguinis]|uniref:galactokinase n=1 Tax=Haematomicrobium sanguinis TaxID=479106 RepID=UPI00068C6581|nr:galactokinase [Haematomicrobium sanguinis]
MNTAESFRAWYRTEPEGVWSGPGRVNLIGEHTDYNLGFVLPFAIDAATQVAVRRREDGAARFASAFGGRDIQEVMVDDVTRFHPGGLAGKEQQWARYPMGVLWAMREAGIDVPGVDVMIESTVPVGSGLSSSAALECAVALAIADLTGAFAERTNQDLLDIAKLAQRAENEVVGAPTGIMDQAASLLGAENAALFLDCRSLENELVPLELAQNGLTLLVIDTRVSHSHADGGYAERRASCELGARLMGVESLRDLGIPDLDRAEEILDEVTYRRVKHVVTENQRVLDTVATLEADGPRAIGPLLDASHESMRDDFEISAPELDLAVETAQAHGAIGARMTGGGFGGSAIALIDSVKEEETRSAILAAFQAAGYGEPGLFSVTPASGARKVD